MFYCMLHEIVGWCRLEAVWAMGHVGWGEECRL